MRRVISWGAKIRRGELERVAHMLVVGAKEKEAGQVSVRSRADRSMDGTMSVDDFLGRVLAEVRERRLRVPTPAAEPGKP